MFLRSSTRIQRDAYFFATRSGPYAMQFLLPWNPLNPEPPCNLSPVPRTFNSHAMRRTKIVATIGPATNSETAIAQLIAAGVAVFRLNFSHGSRETHSEAIARIRAAAEKSGRAIAILQDLAGPKIRIGTLEDGR